MKSTFLSNVLTLGILALVTLACCPQWVQATTRFVSASGGDDTAAINNAISASSAGDTVWLNTNGTYLISGSIMGKTGVTIRGTKNLERRVATLSITVANYDPSDVGTLLDVDHGVLTRTGLQCAPLIHEHMGTMPRGTVRFSVGPFNTMDHVEQAIRGVAEITADRQP